MPDQPPDNLTLSHHRTGWLLSQLRRRRNLHTARREVDANIVRELTAEHREDRMSLNQIAEKTGIPRSTVQRLASQPRDDT